MVINTHGEPPKDWLIIRQPDLILFYLAKLVSRVIGLPLVCTPTDPYSK